MFDNFNNKTEINNTSVAIATANIMVSENAGDWVTFEASAGGTVSGNKFITVRRGHVINTVAFGHKVIDKCDTVEITYFGGKKIETAYIKSTLAEVHKALGIKSKLLTANVIKEDYVSPWRG